MGRVCQGDEAFDAINGVIYAARSDWVNAGLSFAACTAVAGNVATGTKLVAKAVNRGTDVVRADKKIENISSTTRVYTKSNFRANVIKNAGRTRNTAKGLDGDRTLPIIYEINFEAACFKGANSIHNPNYGVLLAKSSHRSDAYSYNQQ